MEVHKPENQTCSWSKDHGIIELQLHNAPCNEIGTRTLEDLEAFIRYLHSQTDVQAVILYSSIPAGFCAGADLRELYHGIAELSPKQRGIQVREFLERIHAVMNALDEADAITIGAVHGIVFGGGFELAVTCDILVADQSARFCFPELRLGLIPGFGGIPRLKRDLGNAVIRDLLFTGRSFNATKAANINLISQLVGEGQALRVARSVAGQVTKFDAITAKQAKRFTKPIPYEELRREIDLFCEMMERPVVEAALRKFVESTDALPYLP